MTTFSLKLLKNLQDRQQMSHPKKMAYRSKLFQLLFIYCYARLSCLSCFSCCLLTIKNFPKAKKKLLSHYVIKLSWFSD